MDRKSFGKSAAPLTPALKVGNTIYVSGQVPRTPEGEIVAGDVREQTDQVLSNIEALLREAGASLADVVKTTVILTDVKRDFAAMNDVYSRRFPDPKPSRTTLGASLAIDILVEIEAIAVLGD